MHKDKNQILYSNITYMYPNIAVIQLFTLDGIRFALITDAVYENYAMHVCVVVRYYVKVCLVKFWNRLMKTYLTGNGMLLHSHPALHAPPSTFHLNSLVL
jgi:hypothetical protein